MAIINELDISTWIAATKSARLPNPIRLRLIHTRDRGMANSPPPADVVLNPLADLNDDPAADEIGSAFRPRRYV